MDTLIRDFKYAVRTTIKSPGVTALALIALALGIGANSAIFSVVNGVILKPLPFEQPDRLVSIWDTQPQLAQAPSSLPDFLDWREQNRSFENMTAFMDGNILVDNGAGVEDTPGGVVSSEFFSVFKETPLLGRTFTSEENLPGRTREVVLSYGLWQKDFGGDPEVVGRSITVSGFPYSIIGVLRPGFNYPQDAQFWIPLRIDTKVADRGQHYLMVVGRLKQEVPLEQAQADMSSIGARLEAEHRDKIAGHGVQLVTLHEQMTGEARPAFMILLGAVALVLLIACANVANLLLARAASRQREVAIRAALGATRRRVVRQLLTESLLLAFVGGALGLLFASWGVDVLVSLSPKDIPRLNEVRLDWWVVAFTALVSITTGVLFGLAPAIQASKADLNEALRDAGRGLSGSARRNRIGRLLVVSEIALALVLLVGAGLLIQSFRRLRQVDPGFRSENVLTMQVVALTSKYQGDEQVRNLYRQVHDRIESSGSIESLGAIDYLPLSGASSSDYFTIEGRPLPAGGEEPLAQFRMISPGYFRSLGIPLIAGRDFLRTDNEHSPQVAIISNTLARRFWPDSNPIGERLRLQGDQGEPLQIVGVAGDTREAELSIEPQMEIYVPFEQDPLGNGVPRTIAFVVRSTSDTGAVASFLRSAVSEVDRSLPVLNVKTMDEYLTDSLARRRFNLLLLTIFAGVALVLATVGIYGVMSYLVSQRTHEMGVRMALGARRSTVVRLIVQQGSALTLGGVGLGLIAAFGLTRLLTGMVYGVSTVDPLTFASISALLAAVSLLACYVPARRATKVDPMIALRNE